MREEKENSVRELGRRAERKEKKKKKRGKKKSGVFMREKKEAFGKTAERRSKRKLERNEGESRRDSKEEKRSGAISSRSNGATGATNPPDRRHLHREKEPSL